MCLIIFGDLSTRECCGSLITGIRRLRRGKDLAQDMIVDIRDSEEVCGDSPLVVCKGCGKLVPRTNLCLYCGSPILYGKNLS
jgi:ribosomal protein L32